MKYSPAEERIMQHVISDTKKSYSVSDLADVVYEGRERPKNWKKSICAIMRYLQLKSKDLGPVAVVRVSPLGRGNEAEYKVAEGRI